MLPIVVVLGLGCAQEQQPPAEEMSTMKAAQPDTTAPVLWAYLEDASYRSWPMWPGKEAFYTGTEPHGMLLTTYVNELALDAITNRSGRMPAGAVVVKENYMPDRMLAAVTVMYKSGGYNTEYGDWFFVKRLADGTFEASGRVAMCQGCHAQRAANDYLFTGSLSQ
jgi:hypothetical protein